jgi:cytochrome b6-f complex iron-sulfur subunit
MSRSFSEWIAPVAPGDETSRRIFLGFAGLAGLSYAGALGYPVYRYLASPVELSAATAAISEVTLRDAQKIPLGSALMFKFGAAPAMLIHHADGSWVAVGAICTHLGCTVQFQPDQNRIFCACHGGTYDPHTGDPTGGPPPRPLRRFGLQLTDDGAVISRV